MSGGGARPTARHSRARVERGNPGKEGVTTTQRIGISSYGTRCEGDVETGLELSVCAIHGIAPQTGDRDYAHGRIQKKHHVENKALLHVLYCLMDISHSCGHNGHHKTLSSVEQA